MRKPVSFYVVLLFCAVLLLGTVMSCIENMATPSAAALPSNSASVPPVPTPEPTSPLAPMPPLTPSAGTVDPSALLPYLPESAQVAGALKVELDGDAETEVVALLGLDGDAKGLGYDHLEMMVVELDRAPAQAVAWRSAELLGERGEGLQARDLNGDGRDEVLSYQSMGAAGYTLYVLGFRGGDLALLKANGGYFDGQDHFGEVGVRLEDIDRDGIYEILASYGPAGSSTDVYKWNGTEYVFGITLQDK